MAYYYTDTGPDRLLASLLLFAHATIGLLLAGYLGLWV